MIKLLSISAKGFKQLDIEELKFPQKGTVLIVGRNESGKSTLFEAVYFALFGEGLVPSRGLKSLPDLLGYGREKGFVTLKFLVGETIFEITRLLKRDGKHDHKLKILTPKPELIKGARAVNKRIEEEMKLDGDALLNSCFVEQKNLEKLENLNSAERQKSIARLLNIESFKEMEDEFKESVKQLGIEEVREKQRLELAVTLEEIPTIESKRKDIEHKLELVDMMHEKARLHEKMEEYEIRFQSVRGDLERLAVQMKDVETAEEGLPSKQERLRSLGDLKESLQAYNELIDKLKEDRTELQKISSDMEHAGEIRGKIERLMNENQDLREDIRKAEVELSSIAPILSLFKNRSLLQEWEVAKKSEDELGLIDEKETELEAQRRLKENERNVYLLQEKGKELKVTVALSISAASIVFAIIFFGLGFFYVKIFCYVGILFCVISPLVYYLGYMPEKRRLSEIKECVSEKEVSLKEYESVLLKLEGQKDFVQSRGRVEAVPLLTIEKNMRELAFPIPASLKDCSTLQADIKKRLADSDEKESTQKYDDITGKIISQNSSLGANEKTINGFKIDLQRLDPQNLERRKDELTSGMENRKIKAKELLHKCEGDSEKFNIQADHNTVVAEFSRLSEEILQDRNLVQKKDMVRKDIEGKNGELSSITSSLEKNKGRIDEIDAILNEDLEARGLDLTKEKNLRDERDVLLGRLTHQKKKAEELQAALGILHADKSECEKKLFQTQRSVSVTKVAQEIVNRARKQIEADVLPHIASNMEKFIPLLTADRYKEVFISPSDYRIEVMDEVAGERRPKNVFSGGTRDQFSLALRLSFALATLPEERGSSPSFIFLDEPIGAFDEERRNALIELLTVGEISECFDQIFIISHFSELEDVFEYKIKMDGGKIVETNLI